MKSLWDTCCTAYSGRNQGLININHSPSLRPSWDLHDETGNETAPPMRMTLNENNSHVNLMFVYGIPGTPPALPPPQIDKVKHEGQILSNIDLSKHPPTLCCPDVTTVSVHHSSSVTLRSL